MLKKVFYLSIAALLIAGCVAKKPKTTSSTLDLPPSISYSSGFIQFMTDLKTESQGLASLDEYLPSNTMKKNFNFIKMPEEVIGVEGFIQVIPDLFDAVKFERLGGYLTFFAKGIYQFKMPVKSLQNMLNVSGLVMVDIPHKQKNESRD
jgi:hypothetical protein